MQSLDYYVEKYGTDKKLSHHTETYNYLFNNVRKEIKSVLEVGVGSTKESDSLSTFKGILSHFPHYTPGGSLRVWRDFFPEAKVYGIDIQDDCLIEEERIKTFIFNSTDKVKCNENLDLLTFDVIIDDGSHFGADQISTLENLFGRVVPGGYYIIEDIGGVQGGEPDFIETFKERFLKVVGKHEFVLPLSNILVIKKTYSEKGNVDKLYNLSSFDDSKLEPKQFTKPEVEDTNLTVVTGLWNISKPGRSIEHYLECFSNLLQMEQYMYIYVPKEFEAFVWERRDPKNTFVKILELDDIKGNYYAPFWDKTQQIRTDPSWYNQTGENGWLKNAPQTVLEWYNPIVQSKMFMLHDVKVTNPFNTDYFIWLDGGITNTVYEKYFTDNKALSKITPHLKTFLFLSYPYETKTEIHGFIKKDIDQFARNDVKYVCRGGLFGGHKDFISQANSTYYSLLTDSLSRGLMGTEESIFSIMAHLEPHIYRRYELDDNGLVVKFIQSLTDGNTELAQVNNRKHVLPKGSYNSSTDKTSLYMLTFNFPEQIEYTLDTWSKSSKDWLEKPRKILLDNSTNEEARIQNKVIADKYGFEHIVTGKNGGICGGRQLAAEHFNDSDSDYYFFFEDDMGMHPESNEYCRNGLRTFVPNLYEKVHKIMAREEFDYLKLSYTEVYMDNNIQVSWYNVPQVIRSSVWPDYDQLPASGLDPYAPRTKFDRIEVQDGLSYITGEIYYANWPMIVSKAGNKKMFIDTKWTFPFEQTWMSYMFQETLKKNLNPACLLASPIKHERIKYYKPEERREN